MAAAHSSTVIAQPDHSLDEPTQPWFAVQVWSGREQFTSRHLCDRGYDVFLPSYRERHRWSDRVKTIAKPLFSGYLFCRIVGDAFGKVATAPGVIRIVGDGQGPLPVPAHEIEAIQRVVATRLAAEPWPFGHAGQRVRIEAGPLRGTEGVVLSVKNGRRVIIAIPLLRRAVAVEIDPEWITS